LERDGDNTGVAAEANVISPRFCRCIGALHVPTCPLRPQTRACPNVPPVLPTGKCHKVAGSFLKRGMRAQRDRPISDFLEIIVGFDCSLSGRNAVFLKIPVRLARWIGLAPGTLVAAA